MPKWKGPLIEVWVTRGGRRYKAQVHADEAEAKGWEQVTITTEPTVGLPDDYEAQAKAELGFWSRLFGGSG